MRRGVFFLAMVAAVAAFGATSALGAADQRGEWVWSPGLCKSNLKRYGVRIADGRTFNIADAFCVGYGGFTHCQWNAAHTKRFYDKFFVVVRSFDGVVRTARLYTTGRNQYELENIRLLARGHTSASFRELAGDITWRLARAENQKGCATP